MDVTEEATSAQKSEETTENENSIGDSGIQIRSNDEDLEPDDTGENNDAGEQMEGDVAADPPIEDTTETNETEEDTATPIETQEDIAADNQNDTDAVSQAVADDYVVSDSATNDNEEIFTSQNDLVTAECMNGNCRNSPEIVVEPKITAGRRSTEKMASQQFIRSVTPVYPDVPYGIKPPSRGVKVPKKRPFLSKLRCCLLLLIHTTVVIGYALGGAYLFSYLERTREIQYNAKIDMWKNDTAILLATELRQVTPHEEVWARKVFRYLELYEKDLLKASALGYRRQDYRDREQRWTWTSSLFFSISLMTTTGYGSMTPRSKYGRVATVAYSILGIPFAFSWFMVIGHILASFWLLLFQNVCCRLCHEKPPKHLAASATPKTEKKKTKLPKLRSNSILPIDKQNLLTRSDSPAQHSAKSRQSMFPHDVLQNELTSRPTSNGIRFKSRTVQMEGIKTKEMYRTIDFAVSIIYALLFFVVYHIFFSIFFAVYENEILTDILYISYLMFVTLGPGCHELDSDGAEIKIKNSLYFIIYLCIGYCLLSMIVNLVYMMLWSRPKPEKIVKSIVFDSLHSEKSCF